MKTRGHVEKTSALVGVRGFDSRFAFLYSKSQNEYFLYYKEKFISIPFYTFCILLVYRLYTLRSVYEKVVYFNAN
jgi:hypothetical protein